MKATLLVNLKIGKETIGAGTFFEDSVEEFPSYVVSNLDNPKVIKLTEGSVKEVKAPKALEAPKAPKADKPKLNRK